MNLSDLEPNERAMFKRGEKKIKTSRNIFGDKDVLFFLKIKELDDTGIKARGCEICDGAGEVECGHCEGSGMVPCECQ